MFNNSNETSLHGTREKKKKRKLTQYSRLLKYLFWVAWAVGKLLNLAKWLIQFTAN